MILSKCCQSKLWLVGASRQYPYLDPNDPDIATKVQRGRTLISELEKIENKLLEVEIEIYDAPTIIPAIKMISKVDKKVIIRPMRKYEK